MEVTNKNCVDGDSCEDIVKSVFNYDGMKYDFSSAIVFGYVPDGYAASACSMSENYEESFSDSVNNFKETQLNPASKQLKTYSTNMKNEIKPYTESFKSKINSLKKSAS